MVRHGRTFLKQLFSLLSRPRPGHHFIHLTAGAQADLLWWKTFLHEWNGLSFFPQASPSVEVTSDASGSFGCGAFSLNHGWFQLEWPDSWNTCHIAAKEMVPIVIAASLWGPQWHRRCVRFRSDNMAVVDVLRSRTSRDPLHHSTTPPVARGACVNSHQLSMLSSHLDCRDEDQLPPPTHPLSVSYYR